MKTLFIILVGLGIVFQSFNKGLIFLTFELNEEYIARNLCVKKDIKNNTCKGKCHLKKQLKEAEKKDQLPSNTFKDIEEFQIFCQQPLSIQFNLHLIIKREFKLYKDGITSFHSFSIFHPPKA